MALVYDKLKSPSFEIALGSILISFSSVFVKLTTTGPTVDGFYRMLFGAIGLFVMALIRKESFAGDKRGYILAIIAGVMLAFDLTFWHRSIHHIGPGLATIIINLQVFVLGLIGFLYYGEKVNWKYMLSIPVAIMGMYLLIGTGWQTHGGDFKLGIVQCFIAMLAYTLYIFNLRASQQTARHMATIPNLTIVCVASTMVLGLIALYTGESFMVNQQIDWLWLVLYGIFGQILGWLLISRGLPHISITRAGFLILLQPAGSFLWDILFFNRVTVGAEVFGAVLTLIAIFINNTGRIVQKSDEEVHSNDKQEA